jgi:hypothetical protein
MKIKIFSHCVDITDEAKLITTEQADLLEMTGLLDVCDELNMFIHYKEESFDWIKERWKNKDNVNWIFDPSVTQDDFECVTVHKMQQQIINTEEDCYVLFLHHKGAWNVSDYSRNWRHYMQYWNIERWRDCVEKLDEGYDTVGAGWVYPTPVYTHPFFAGNIYWATSQYIKSLPLYRKPSDVNYEPQFDYSRQPQPIPNVHRYDPEVWSGSGNPKFYDLHPGSHNRWALPPHTYR